MPGDGRGIAIVSREYKMMLKAARFQRDEATRVAAVDECWSALLATLGRTGLRAEGTLKRAGAGKQRLVRFYDTDEGALYRGGGFIFRMRRRQDGQGTWKATLKHRSADWIRAASAVFAPAGEPDDAKFEEDIKGIGGRNGLQFVPLFSHSAEAKSDGEDMPRTIADCLKPFRISRKEDFPDLVREVALVGFEARESVWSGVDLVLPGDTKAELVLILWDRADGDEAVAAELSFRCAVGDGPPKGKVARAAWWAFLAFDGAEGWVDRTGPTKTALIYGDW